MQVSSLTRMAVWAGGDVMVLFSWVGNRVSERCGAAVQWRSLVTMIQAGPFFAGYGYEE